MLEKRLPILPNDNKFKITAPSATKNIFVGEGIGKKMHASGNELNFVIK